MVKKWVGVAREEDASINGERKIEKNGLATEL